MQTTTEGETALVNALPLDHCACQGLPRVVYEKWQRFCSSGRTEVPPHSLAGTVKSVRPLQVKKSESWGRLYHPLKNFITSFLSAVNKVHELRQVI